MSISIDNISYIKKVDPLLFRGDRLKYLSNSHPLLELIQNDIINAANDSARTKAILQFKKNFTFAYDMGEDKWQNPLYHQYTISDHMLKTMEQAALIVKGSHSELNKILTPVERVKFDAMFNEKIDGISKGTLFVLGMAFHDLDKVFNLKPKKNKDGKIIYIEPAKHSTFEPGKQIKKEQSYWKSEPDPVLAIKLFDDISKSLNITGEARDYINNIMKHHDNPLRYISWQIEKGRKNPSKLFDEMKQNTPVPLHELAMVYLADQSGKGEAGWLDHLEVISPWRCIFKSMVAERPLKELDQLIRKNISDQYVSFYNQRQ
jgi:hypothetical protein